MTAQTAAERVLITSLQFVEADFAGRVGTQLMRRGHAVAHVTHSRLAARRLRRTGAEVWCLPELMASLAPVDVDAEVERMSAAYAVPTFRDVYSADLVCEGADERWALERTVRHLLGMEQVFDAFSPTAVVPEVGNETIRTAAHLVGLRRGVPVLFLLNTIFDDPLRLNVDELQAPIVEPGDLRPLTDAERAEVRAFTERFLARDKPIRAYRDLGVRAERFRVLARHLAVRLLVERDNEYLRPLAWIGNDIKGRARARLARVLYEDSAGERPFLYFPLHVWDDYKLKKLIPHRADQLAIVEVVARALPHGYDLVVKEHPNSIGRNRFLDLLAMRRLGNVRVVQPRFSSNELIRRSAGVVAISSTVGIEALLQHKRVMTLGKPYYAGAGVTRDLYSLAELRTELPAFVDAPVDADRIDRFLHAAMRATRPGAPVLIDRSDENAAALAGSLEAALAQRQASRRSASRQSAAVSMLSDASESTR
ncbi:MAG: hypothetical protein WKF94_02930 [Solirubrobacteraceae bacterium]